MVDYDELDKANKIDYNDNPELQKLWKVFGRETGAGRELFNLFQTGKP